MLVVGDEVNYFKTLYVPTHLNIGNYFIGVAAGLFHHKLKQSKEIHQKPFVSESFHFKIINQLVVLNFSPAN